MFQRAEPELKGFGVTTCTPGLTRSAQPLMCLGLPLRTAKTTTVFASTPPYDCLSHFESTSPESTSRFTSPPHEKNTTSASSPDETAFAWSVDAPYDWLNETSLPSGVCWKASMILPKTVFGVEYATTDSDEPFELFVPPVAAAAAASATAARLSTAIFRRGMGFPLFP